MPFDPVNGLVQNHISAREIWLLYPKHFDLAIVEGSGSLLEVLPELPGEWAKFKLECWDLTETVRIGLIQLGQMVRELYIRGQEKLPQPYLQGGKLVFKDLEDDPVPCYAGPPPDLNIPIRPLDDLQAELSRWRLKLDSIGPSDPQVSIQRTLWELGPAVCAMLENVLRIQLENHELLGSRPAGTYQISLKGPLGRDAALTLNILPECHLTGLRELYLPDPKQGAEKVSFTLQTSLLDHVDDLNNGETVRIEELNPGFHRITVPPEVSAFGLLIRRETIDQQWICIPFQLRLQRLRWRLVTGSGQEENWHQNYFSFSVRELLEEEVPILLIDLPGNQAGEYRLRLNVLDHQGVIIQQCSPSDRSAKRASRFWRFDLSKIKHLLEVNGSPIFRVDLVCLRGRNDDEAFCLPVLLLASQINISKLNGDVYSSSNFHHVLATWQEKKPIRSRALILWSLFQPWQPPVLQTIPDAVVGEYEFELSRRHFVNGIYRMQMVAVDPWAVTPPPPTPPALGSAGCVDVQFSSPSARLEALDHDVLLSPECQSAQLRNRIERSLIYKHIGQIEECYRDLEACCRILLQASPREILTLQSILVELNAAQLSAEFGRQLVFSEML